MKLNSTPPLHFGITPEDIKHCQLQQAQKKDEWHFELKINQKAKLTEPIIIRGTSGNEQLIHLNIEVGQNAKVDLIEHWEGVHASKININMTLKAATHAHVRYIALQSDEETKEWQEKRQTHAEEGAKIDLFLFHFGAKAITSQTEQNAQGRNAQIETWITSRRRNSQTMKLNYQHRFHDREGGGQAHLQGVALDEGQLEMKGNIWIGRQGGGTDTHLEEKALNLSLKAQVNAMPGLEVDTNDVKAGHSAAVHNLNPEQLIYLQTRGLDAQESRRLMMEGFLKNGLREIKDLPAVYEKIHQLI